MTPTTFPTAVKVKNINRESATHKLYKTAWDLMYWLYVGGVEIESQAEQFLKKRPKEPSDVYQARVEQFVYENHVGTCVDWYAAALLEKPPRIQPAAPVSGVEIDPATNDVPSPDEMLDDDQREFYDALEKNSDRAGLPMLEQLRHHFKNLLLYGRSAMLIDLPKNDGQFVSAAQEREAGQLDPFVVGWDSRQVINLARDSDGNLSWIMFFARQVEESDGPFGNLKKYDRWYYFDTQSFATYQREVPSEEKVVPDDAQADLLNSGLHAMSDVGKVPVIYDEVPEGLWLLNRAFTVARKHLNVSNTLDWSLFMSAMAMPVIKMDGEYDLTLSESGYIKLPLNAEYGWLEPEGKSHTLLADRVQALMEAIFRAFYLMGQARSNKATPAAQSGLSKQQDMTASKKILNLFGDIMRTTTQRVYDYVSQARGDELQWDVRGLNFPEDPPDEMLDMIATAQSLDVPSDIFEKELDKLTIDSVFPDANSALKEKMYEQVRTAPSRQDRDLEQKQQTAAALVGTKLGKQDFSGV